ncbi:copper chaperone PCu(A)C [Roseateles sp.]|uniref:copper chaperone PCu(A)C n=1 Tax=Roseateles sp. TaxID=1971397 RepID=UPI0039E764C2
MTFKTLLIATSLIGSLTSAASAQVVAKDAWARATVAQQKASGAFMLLTAAQDARLVSVSSPEASVIEIHEMTMQDQVMKMRPVPYLALPAGQTVELKPGGYHLMLLDLKKPLTAGARLPLTLVIEGSDGKRARVEVAAEIRSPGVAGKSGHAH